MTRDEIARDALREMGLDDSWPTADVTAAFGRYAGAVLREAIAEVRGSWTFDEFQGHTHTWHDREDCLERLRARADQEDPKGEHDVR